MALCNVTGTVYLPNGQLARSRTIVFRRVNRNITAEYLGTVLPDDVIAQTSATGQISVELLTGYYVAHAEGCYVGKVAVPDAPDADFSDIIIQGEIPQIPPAWYEDIKEELDGVAQAVEDANEAASTATQAAADAQDVADGLGSIADSVARQSAPALDQTKDHVASLYEHTALDGGKHLVGLNGKSVQDHINWLREKVVNGPAKFSPSAPSIARMTDAQNAHFGLIDMVGGLHLTGLGGVSVQGHISALRSRISDVVASGGAAALVINAVDDLGCDNTGVTPIQTIVNSAIAKLNANIKAFGGRATIYFPEGVYALSERIYPGSNISFVGAGRGTVFMPSGIRCVFERKNPKGTYTTSCIFANFRIDGANQVLNGGSYDVGTKGIFIQGFRDCLFTDLIIENTGATGLGIDFADRSIIQRVRVENCGRLGVAGSSPGASGIGIGTGWSQSEPLLIADCYGIGNKNYGIFVERQSSSVDYFDAYHNIITGCMAKGNNYGFGEEGCAGTIVSGCQFTDNLSGGIVQHEGTFGSGPHPGQRFIVRGCDISRNGGHGWAFDGSDNFGPRGYSSEGNRIEGNAGAGHHIIGGGGTVDDFRIGSDEVIGNGSHGIHFASGTLTNVDITNPRLINNTGSAIRLDANITGGRVFGATMRDMRGGSATQTGSITGSGNLTNFDISETVGVGAAAISLTGTLTGVTYGRNQGV